MWFVLDGVVWLFVFDFHSDACRNNGFLDSCYHDHERHCKMYPVHYASYVSCFSPASTCFAGNPANTSGYHESKRRNA